MFSLSVLRGTSVVSVRSPIVTLRFHGSLAYLAISYGPFPPFPSQKACQHPFFFYLTKVLTLSFSVFYLLILAAWSRLRFDPFPLLAFPVTLPNGHTPETLVDSSVEKLIYRPTRSSVDSRYLQKWLLGVLTISLAFSSFICSLLLRFCSLMSDMRCYLFLSEAEPSCVKYFYHNFINMRTSELHV